VSTFHRDASSLRLFLDDRINLKPGEKSLFCAKIMPDLAIKFTLLGEIQGLGYAKKTTLYLGCGMQFLHCRPYMGGETSVLQKLGDSWRNRRVIFLRAVIEFFNNCES
jgi:hypothetical protein